MLIFRVFSVSLKNGIKIKEVEQMREQTLDVLFCVNINS